MGKPFSDLEKRAFTILANGGDPAASQDSELASYWRWRINPSLNSHDLPAASERPDGRKLDDVYINPFGVDMPTGVFAKVSASQRALTYAQAGLKTALQHTTLAATETGFKLGNFKPAKVYLRTGAAATSLSRTSRITGREYKSYYAREDEGYTYPFGQNNDAETLSDRQSEIRTAILAQDSTINLISFSPEKYSG